MFVAARNLTFLRFQSDWTFFTKICHNGKVINTRQLFSLTALNEPNERKWSKFRNTFNSKVKSLITTGVFSAVIIGSGLYVVRSKNLEASSSLDQPDVWIPTLPVYSEDDVAKHKTIQDRVWVTYKSGVYDITEFLNEHPGGSSKILLAAGGSLEPFWNIYAIHNDNEQVFDILSGLRIGNIKRKTKEKQTISDDPFASDPERNPILVASAAKPFNAEPPTSILIDNYITPNDIFFVRNHLPVPIVDVDKFKLCVGCDGGKVRGLTLNMIKNKFKKKFVTSTIQCAGNRRSEFNRHKQVKGNNWNSSALSTATWGGVSLKDLFEFCGIDINSSKYHHVKFDGLDKDMTGACYGSSIPIEVARGRLDDILIAYEMNGEPLPYDHGFPLRVIIPGCVGARQVKWLNKISLSVDESNSHWQQLDYKGFNPSLDLKDLDYSKSFAITDLPVTSAICEPNEGDVISGDNEFVVMKGYAWSGGGRGILRVDVSTDGGQTWVEADLSRNEQNLYKSWAWTLWEAVVPLPKDQDSLELICKATDVSYNVQPDGISGIWNPRGVLNNSWHRVFVRRS